MHGVILHQLFTLLTRSVPCLNCPIFLRLLCHSQQESFLATSPAQVTERRILILYQVIRRVVFQDMTMIEHKDLVESNDGLESVCNTESCDTCQIFPQDLLDCFIGFVIFEMQTRCRRRVSSCIESDMLIWLT